jgi:signal peptidase
MSGSYDRGSVVFEEVVPVNDLEVGDVITYLPPAESGIDHLVTHRIVSIEDGDLRTKGDAVAQVDPWTFRLESVSQPRVAYSVPYVGWVLIGLQDPSVRVALIGVLCGLVALIVLGQVAGASRRRRPAVARTFATTGPAASATATVALHGAVQLLRRSR